MYRRPLSAFMSVALAAGLSPLAAFAADSDMEFDYHVSPEFYNPISLSAQEQAFLDAIRDNPDYFLSLEHPILYSQPATKFGYVWPLPDGGGITQHFGNAGHTGVDIGIGQGSPVVSCMDGYVKYVQTWDGYSRGGMQSYGNLVIVYHPTTGHSTYYAHLDKIAVRTGQEVAKGQLIGRVGTTGNSTGFHLHIELHVGANPGIDTYGSGDGMQVDPLRFIDRNYLGPFGDDPIELEAAKRTRAAENAKKAAAAAKKAKTPKTPTLARNANDDRPLLAQGTYCIVPAVAVNKALDATLGEADQGAIAIGNRMQNAAQLFTIIANGDGTVRIASKKTGNAITGLDAHADNENRTDDASAVAQQPWSGEASQRWNVVSRGHGWYSFQNAQTGLMLDVAEGKSDNGTFVQQTKRSTDASQKFSLLLWDTSLSSDRIVVGGVKSSYEYLGQDIEPAPYILRLINSYDSLRVSSSVDSVALSASTSTQSIADVAEEISFEPAETSALDAQSRNFPAASNDAAPLAYVMPTRTYQVEIDGSSFEGSEPTTLRLRVLDSNGLDVSPAQEIAVSDARTTLRVKPTRSCTLYLEAVSDGADDDSGDIAARGVRVYEVLKNSVDYSIDHDEDVHAGTGAVAIVGKGGYTGSKIERYEIENKSLKGVVVGFE